MESGGTVVLVGLVWTPSGTSDILSFAIAILPIFLLQILQLVVADHLGHIFCKFVVAHLFLLQILQIPRDRPFVDCIDFVFVFV